MLFWESDHLRNAAFDIIIMFRIDDIVLSGMFSVVIVVDASYNGIELRT